MDQYLLIPFLGGWTSIYQLFWRELQGYKVLTHCHIAIENGPVEIVDISQRKMVIFHSYVNVYQRVIPSP